MKRIPVLISVILALAISTGAYAGDKSDCPGCKELPKHYGIEVAGMKIAPVLVVLDARPNSGAEKAGLGPLDLILAMKNGKSESTMDGTDHQNFRNRMENEARKSGALLDILKYQEDGSYQPQKVRLLLNREPGSTSDFATKFGVVVTEVAPGGQAENTGIRQWDFVETLNGAMVAEMNPIIFSVALDKAISQGSASVLPAKWKVAIIEQEDERGNTVKKFAGTYTKKRASAELVFGQ